MSSVVKRDSKGRLLPGTASISPGRQKRSTETKYLQAMRETVSLDAWVSIIERAILDAQDGNVAARRWLSDYLIGKPTQQVKLETTSLTSPETDNRIRDLAIILQAILQQRRDSGDDAVVIDGTVTE